MLIILGNILTFLSLIKDTSVVNLNQLIFFYQKLVDAFYENFEMQIEIRDTNSVPDAVFFGLCTAYYANKYR
jgi:hypothetical protein